MAKFINVKEKAFKELTHIMMAAVKIRGRSISRACLFCCEELHGKVYQRGVKRDDTMYLLPNHEWKEANSATNISNKVQNVSRECMKRAIGQCLAACRLADKNGEMWGIEIRRGAKTFLQKMLLEKGSDWIPQLGGSGSPFAQNYSCRNKRCRCIPLRADKWMRFALMLMQSLTKDEFLELVRTLSADKSQHLTEASFKDKQVIVNPEWRCPLCITTFEGSSWELQALMCDTRTDTNSTDKIFIAPLGRMSHPVQRAFGYLKLVTLMNELKGVDFKVHDMINAISKINARYAERIIKSQSVKHVRTWSADQPHVPEYAATTTKQLFCINSQLSLRNGVRMD